MDKFVLGITIVILGFSIYKYYVGQFDELVAVKSTIDGKEYYVQNLPDKQEASDNLAKMRDTLVKIVNYMTEKFSSDENIQRLKTNFNPDKIVENPSDSKYTSYSINKGQKIVFCIRQRNEKNNLVDMNTLTFVAIHELSHLMTKSVGHTNEFWENMQFLLKEVINSPLNVYKYQDFHNNPIEYCGTKITDTPYRID